jgi:hypothetical protein
VRILESKPGLQRPARRYRTPPVGVTRDHFRIHAVVVLLTVRPDRIRRRRAAGRRVVLVLEQVAPCDLGVDAGDDLAAGEWPRRRQHQAAAVLPVVLHGLPEQEMLEEIHA